jgi:glycosyltransferase involved in cell wall biosynthesis
VSFGIKSDLIKIFKVNPKKLVVIYNPCFNNSDIFTRPSKINKKLPVQFVAAGRLETQKGFDLLIEAFLMLPKTLRHNSTLTIFGSGNKKENLKSLIPQNEQKRIIFAGSRSNLLKNLRNFDVFILSSRYEGFGNVLAEALAGNCFCVSYQIKHGPKEILMNGRLGLLIKNNDAISLSEGLLFASNNFSVTNRLFNNKLRIAHLKKFTTETFSFSVANLIKKYI